VVTSVPPAVVTIDSPPGKEQIHPNASKKEKSGKQASASFAKSNASANAASTQLTASASNSNLQVLQSSVQELRRQLDQTRSLKEQSESKVGWRQSC
jgi:hypothetical protein